jgi:hypothetical protein
MYGLKAVLFVPEGVRAETVATMSNDRIILLLHHFAT